ncbi:AlpA family phage regulatory protein [Morganella morganii]|uniref:helix-turn-helix transcriptional regulator n=1 Tax=Morganella morganii TaxID=582 RepID=UPI003EBC11B5
MTNQTILATSLLNDQFVDMKFITRFTGLTDKWFYKQIQSGKFPKPIKLGSCSRWLKSEVEIWMENCIEQSRNS